MQITLGKLCIDDAARTFCCELSESKFRVFVLRFDRKFCKLCELLPVNGARFRVVVFAFESDSMSVSPKNRRFGGFFDDFDGLKSGDGD